MPRLLSVSLLLLAACAPVIVPGKLYEPDGSPVSEPELVKLRAARLDALVTRAAFGLRAKREDLRVTCLAADPNGRCVTGGVEVGERRASYVWQRTGVGESQWTLDGASAR
jgi:hypothetical protein